MSVLRFPNAVSDIAKFIDTFKKLYSNLNNEAVFTHDDATNVLVNLGLASSSGAIGQEALRRSTRADRTRDPLYNQHKMYSEVYRMLGWYQPGSQRTNFTFTDLASTINEATDIKQKKIFEECVIGITFPNFLVENRGGNNIRPFLFLLKIMNSLGGLILRDEIIVSVLNLNNDREHNILKKQINKILKLRTDYKLLTSELLELSHINETQINTLQNYTRFILGTLVYNGWAIQIREKSIYNKKLVSYKLTDYGKSFIDGLNYKIDIRHSDIVDFNIETRASFTLLSFYSFYKRIGYSLEEYRDIIKELITKCEPIFTKFKIESIDDVIYYPIQQSTREEIDLANQIEEKHLYI